MSWKTNRRTRLALLCLSGITASAAPVAAAEPQKVGQAEIIRNEVLDASEESRLVPINVGDHVVRDEIIRTSTDANARFGLIDNTKLTLGPGSTLKIDRAVLADESRYKQITIRLTEGAFRFITGNSDKKSYRIETPSATIGVRGTILDIRITDNETLVALQDGRANVCAGRRCTQLTQRGQTATATLKGGIPQIRRDLVPAWTFASICSANASLCAPLPALTRKANLTAPALGNAGKKGTIIRFCPDGQPMKGSSCAPGLETLRETSLPTTPSRDLPLLNNPTRDAASLPDRPSIPPISPSVPPPNLGGTGLPSGGPRLSVPSLGR
jgi:hypothetical protein